VACAIIHASEDASASGALACVVDPFENHRRAYDVRLLFRRAALVHRYLCVSYPNYKNEF